MSESQLDKPKEWATGGDAPTSKQKAFLQTLAGQKGAEINPSSMNKSEASMKIDELKNAPTQNLDSPVKGPSGEQKDGELVEDPKNWATGDDPATGKQRGYIAAMAKQAGETVPGGEIGKGEASQKIESLKQKTGM